MNTVVNTPTLCHNCFKFSDCTQAQNMNADTHPVEGYVCDGDVYCADCLDGNDGSDYSGVPDTPTHCGGCGVPIMHELTSYGVEYVRKTLADHAGCCEEVWRTVWADYLT